jgi:hypothetical protein
MSCSGLVNVLSGVALICGPRRDRPRADHNVIDTGRYRSATGTIIVALASKRYQPAPSVPLTRRFRTNHGKSGWARTPASGKPAMPAATRQPADGVMWTSSKPPRALPIDHAPAVYLRPTERKCEIAHRAKSGCLSIRLTGLTGTGLRAGELPVGDA